MALNFGDFGAAAGPVGATPAGRSARLGASLSGTNLARAGDYNQRIVLQTIRRNPDITRTEIAVITGLTAPTIANITARLFEADLILEASKRRGGRGQPASRLQIRADGCFAVGLNIDRDHVTLVTLDLAGVVRTHFTRSAAFAMPEDVRDMVRGFMDELRAQNLIPPDRILGMGVAMPDDLGRVVLPHMPADYGVWSGIDLRQLLGDVVPWSIHVDNDAAAAAIGEAQFGSGVQYASFFYILISAGLGGGLVIDGAYYRGATARSGELGFLPLPVDTKDGSMLQDLVSLSALALRLERGGVVLEPVGLTAGLPAGSEAIVTDWLDEATTALVPALTSINCLINPAAVLIGGRLPDAILDRLALQAQDKVCRAAPGIPSVAPIRRATLSRDAPAVGAAILPFLDCILPSDSILMK